MGIFELDYSKWGLLVKLISSKNLTAKVIVGLFFALSVFMIAPATAKAGTSTTPPCPTNSNFLGVLVPWYNYLKSDFGYINGICSFKTNFVNSYSGGESSINYKAGAGGIDVIWLVALAIFEDLLRIAGMVAVGFVIYGGIRYTTSQGEPENTKAARDTIINALVGTAIVVAAAAAVTFIGNALGS